MMARVVASLCHGAFMGIGSVVVVGIVAENRRASAVALMWAGIASANILGVLGDRRARRAGGCGGGDMAA
jgi:DHA1 family inner membrane transport protein